MNNHKHNMQHTHKCNHAEPYHESSHDKCHDQHNSSCSCHKHHEDHHEHHGCSCHSHHDCGCSHSHAEIKKSDLIVFILTALVFAISHMLNLPSRIIALITILSTVLCGYKIFVSGIKSLVKLKFDENTLILIAAIAAIIMGETGEGYLITLLFGIGQFLEDYAVGRSRKKIESLIDITGDSAYNELGEKIDPTKLKCGDVILVRPGEKLCTDAKILKGESSFDASSLTGESLPIDKKSGDEILAGSVNLTSSVVCVATSDYSNSTAAKIRNYVTDASARKATTEKFITKFAKVYTPVVILLSLVLAFVLPITGICNINDSIRRALTFMIASCPCALVISIPLSYYAAIGTASKRGILIKGSMYINTLAKANSIAFDKTGTLTTGKIKLSNVECLEITKEEALKYAAALEIHSAHPIATAICNCSSEDKYEASDVKEHFGKGISGTVNGHDVVLGNGKLAKEFEYINDTNESDGLTLYIDGKKAAIITLSDEEKPDAFNLMEELRKLGFKSINVLSGDNNHEVAALCKKLGKIRGIGELLPHQKADKIASLKKRSKGVIFVGDGVNDAPALAEADFSISVGNGSSLALETGDATLMSPSLVAISKTIKAARYTMKVIFTNIVFALGIKIAVLILASLGKAPIWLALFADVGVLIITILNSLSILYKK